MKEIITKIESFLQEKHGNMFFFVSLHVEIRQYFLKQTERTMIKRVCQHQIVKLIALWLMLFACVHVHAQRERNYIYLFDCTQSMIEQEDIWQQTKDWLRDDIRQLESGQITVVPFQGKAYEPIVFDRESYDAEKVEKTFDEYIKNRTNTSICGAWDEGLNFIDPHKDNYLFVLTDGVDNVEGKEAVCERIRRWCGQYKNSRVFYVMLTKAAKDPKLIEAIEQCNTVFLIDGQGKHLPPFGAFTQDEVVFNTREYLPVTICFSGNGHYKARVVGEDPLFETMVSDIENGRATLTIKPRIPQEELLTRLEGKDDYCYNVKLEGEGVNILNGDLRIRVINKPERKLDMPTEEINTGRATHYDAFLFKGESTPDTLFFTLPASLNEEARKYHSAAQMQLSSETISQDDYTLLFDGQPQADKTITLDERADEHQLAIIFNGNAPTGKHYFTLHTTGLKELDRIGGTEAQEYELSIRARYTSLPNPLAVYLGIMAAVLVGLLILWFLAIKPMLYSTFKVSRLMLTAEPSLYENYRIKGAREVRFTRTGRDNQGTFNRWFTGKIITKQNPFEDAPDWSMKPRSGKGAKGGTLVARGYIVEPTLTVTNRDEEPTTISWDAKTIEIKLL